MNNREVSLTEEIDLRQVNEQDIERKAIQLISYIRIITTSADTVQISRIIQELEVWRKQSECWLISLYILRAAAAAPAAADADVYFSVLNIVVHKLQADFYQLPGELHEQLRGALFSLLRALSQARVVRALAKLSEAIAALSLQMESWAAPIGDVIAHFGANAAEAPCAIYALMFMPEVSTRANVRVRSGRRREYALYLKREVPRVFEFLQCWLQNSGADEGLQDLIFKCLHKWFYACDVSLDVVRSSPLTAAMFLALSKPNLFDTAIDCVCELVSVAK